MKITCDKRDGILALHPQGRLDAFGTRELQQLLDAQLDETVQGVIIDLQRVEYLSSAGLRLFLSAARAMEERQGFIAIAGLQAYARQVMNISGLGGRVPEYPGLADARAAAERHVREIGLLAQWDQLETTTTPIGRMRFIPGTEEPGGIEVLGDIQDVLQSRVTPEHIISKPFSETEYSLGLGGLGDRLSDYFGLMGEMVTVGGTMVWLPTDGHDTADFLIPRQDGGEVELRTGFNVSIAGPFNELIYFEADQPTGATIGEIYRALFDLAKERRWDYRGALGIAMRAEMGKIHGSGVLKSPVIDNKPANGKMIIDPSNFESWFEIDRQPRHHDLTGLISGAGVDTTADLSLFDREHLEAAFYVNPGNPPADGQILHNHGVFFNSQPMPDRAVNLEKEISRVVEKGDFLDMRHLLDLSTVKSALIGVVYVQAFRPDPRGRRGH